MKSDSVSLPMLFVFVVHICNQIVACRTDTELIPILNRKLVSGISDHLTFLFDTTNNCKSPTNFPTEIELTQETFHNWAEDIVVNNVWMAFPKTVQEVVNITNWARKLNYKLRASGFMHNWSPLTVTQSDNCSKKKILFVRTTKYLTHMKIISEHEDSSGVVKVQTGVSLEKLMTFLENHGYGIYTSPAPGDITIGGVLAVGGHGTGVPTPGEILSPGFTYGSISNLVISFTAIIWDSSQKEYIHREFHRSEEESAVFLTNLGRTFLFDVTLRVGRNFNLRCQSFIDIPASELFANPNSSKARNGRTIEHFLNTAGRFETIWFSFTRKPWLKVWTKSPKKPAKSKEVTSPFNYPFSDNIPTEVALLTRQIIEGGWFLAPTLGATEYAMIKAGLSFTGSNDIWGLSKNLLLYIKSTTLKVTANGYAVIISRKDVQGVIYSAVSFYQKLLKEYKRRGEFPINGPLEIRVTGLDEEDDINILNAESPVLSVVRPVEGRPDLNTAVWFDILTFPGTPLANSFLKDLEDYFLFQINDGINAVVRPEWSKGWAYTEEGPFTNSTILSKIIPNAFQAKNKDFDWAAKILKKYDPLDIFTNDFLADFLK